MLKSFAKQSVIFCVLFALATPCAAMSPNDDPTGSKAQAAKMREMEANAREHARQEEFKKAQEQQAKNEKLRADIERAKNAKKQ